MTIWPQVNKYFRKTQQNFQELNLCYKLILKYGDLEDANMLADVFISDPTKYESRYLLEPIKVLGDLKTAEKIFNISFEGNKIRDAISENVLSCLGYLGYEPIKEILLKYLMSDDYYLNSEACIGLLHFDCKDYKDLIVEKIEKCFEKSLFKEFVPSLAVKVHGRNYIQRLYELGKHKASVDCNAGIILAIALFKERELFKNILWDETWEVIDLGTGTGYWSFVGMQYLNITFKELFIDIKKMINEEVHKRKVIYCLSVLRTLLDRRLNFLTMPFKFSETKEEGFKDIYSDLFDNNESVTDFIYNYTKDENLTMSYYDMKKNYEFKIESELLEEIISQSIIN